MRETDLEPRHHIEKVRPHTNYKAMHFLFLAITLLGILSLLLNIGINLKEERFLIRGTLPEIALTLLGLALFLKFTHWKRAFCKFYDDKMVLSPGELDHDEEELFFEHISAIIYERKLVNRQDEERCHDRICFLYESQPVHLDPTGWPDDFHRLLNHYAQEYTIPLTIDEELQKTYKINA